MATQSVQKNPAGPFWPLGAILVPTPGTPVRLTSLIDPNNYNPPEQPTLPQSAEYTVRAQQLCLQGFTPTTHGMTANTGNVYLIQKGGAGSNNRDDYGSIIAVIQPGGTIFLASSALNRNVFSPYELWVDADNASDALLVTLIIQ